ncbi:unnamed protein product [Phyllotreta striolata]|uniref:C2H2-type domain-containing protein n=1 Tax=Phyllotreta striolata TaxID=444603 RepID=A0A9N9XLM9_PHYSR|nr:unnamed protein product [Phyllotreta striolata]
MNISRTKSTKAALNKGYRIDELECSACCKYLSVKPIKVYEGDKLKCGRCSKEDDGGIFSELNSYDENQLFKCHNRFAGCRKLLTSSQARAHEATCRDYIYSCPYCPGLFMQSFLLERHFLERHYTYVLKQPVVLISYGFRSSSFLYKINDFLFLIVFKVDLALGVCHIFNTPVGDKSVALKYHNITMETSNIIEPMEELHVPTNLQAMQLQLNPKADLKSYLKVVFRYDVVDIPFYEPLPLDPNNEILSEPPELLEELKIVRSLEIFQNLCARFGIAWPFAFDVTELPTNIFTNDDYFYITEIENLISTKIYLNCYKCFTSSYNGPMKGVFVKINRSAFFLCCICCQIKIKENRRIKYKQYFCNSLRNFNVRFPDGKDCYSILQLSDFIEDSSKRFDCPFLLCKISGTYLEISVHIDLMFTKFQVLSQWFFW